MKKTYQAFPVKKLPEELRRGLGADGVVEITIEAPEAITSQPEDEADPVDLAAPGAESRRNSNPRSSSCAEAA